MSDDITRLIRSIYAAVLDEDQLDVMFAKTMSMVGASSGWVNDFRPDGVTPVVAAVNINPETEVPYRDHFFRNDPWAIVRDKVSADRATNLERLVPAAEFLKSEVYNGLLVPTQSDIAHCLALRTDIAERNRLMTFFRGGSGGPFGRSHERLLDMLGPHLRLMFEARERWPASDRRVAAAAAGSAADAMFAFDRKGRIHDANPAGFALLTRGGLAHVGFDRALCWSNPGDQLRIDAALGRCLQVGIGCAIDVHTADGGRYSLVIDRVRHANAAGDIAVVMSLRDVTEMIRRKSETAASAFSLSSGERLLAVSLLEGSTIEQHARRRGSAVDTVRKQLASLFRKCGVSRQAALVALLLTLPDSMPL